MAQSPVIPAVMQNLEFMEHYIDCLENLPLDVQRHISQIREYDILYKNKLASLGRYLCLYQQEPPGPEKKNYLNKVQKCLIKSQHYGDVKLNLISQIMELVDNRSELLVKDADIVSPEKKEEENKNLNNNTNNNGNPLKDKLKIEKSNKVIPKELPSSKSIYDKPKRIRRVRAEKSVEKSVEKTDRSNSRASNKPDKEEEEEPMEEDEEPEAKPKKDLKKSSKDRDVKLKEKEKEKERVTKEDKEEKEEKKIERKDKNTSGKVTKKPNNKIQSSKMKKQKKKKEKEVVTEDIPIDPDEPTYCICNRISFGDMIGCDNDSCVFEWFHFECVNLTQKPKGKWYCSQCTTERKEKNKK